LEKSCIPILNYGFCKLLTFLFDKTVLFLV
jgi:hypothetical protein